MHQGCILSSTCHKMKFQSNFRKRQKKRKKEKREHDSLVIQFIHSVELCTEVLQTNLAVLAVQLKFHREVEKKQSWRKAAAIRNDRFSFTAFQVSGKFCNPLMTHDDSRHLMPHGCTRVTGLQRMMMRSLAIEVSSTEERAVKRAAVPELEGLSSLSRPNTLLDRESIMPALTRACTTATLPRIKRFKFTSPGESIHPPVSSLLFRCLVHSLQFQFKSEWMVDSVSSGWEIARRFKWVSL